MMARFRGREYTHSNAGLF